MRYMFFVLRLLFGLYGWMSVTFTVVGYTCWIAFAVCLESTIYIGIGLMII